MTAPVAGPVPLVIEGSDGHTWIYPSHYYSLTLFMTVEAFAMSSVNWAYARGIARNVTVTIK